MNSIRTLLAVVFLACASNQVWAQALLAGSIDAGDTTHAAANPRLQSTPLVMQAGKPPIPVKGGDGHYHLVYELYLENFTGGRVSTGPLRVLVTKSGAVVADFGAAQVATRLVVRDRQAVPGQFDASQLGILYLHVILDAQHAMPQSLDHRLTMTADGATTTPAAARLSVLSPTDLVLEAPLKGTRYIAGDGCCDSTRHIRATLPLN